MNFKLTLNQRRFLIVWICFHSFVLFVNLADISVNLDDGSDTITYDSLRDKIYTRHYNNLFTSGTYKEDFWPFTTYTKNESNYPSYSDGRIDKLYFFGIFNSYDFTEYAFYIILGFAIIYIPKFWGSDENAKHKETY